MMFTASSMGAGENPSASPKGCLDSACRLNPPRIGLTGGESNPWTPLTSADACITDNRDAVP